LPHEDTYPVIQKLERKLVKISDWLVVAWTGDLIAAKSVLKMMFKQFRAKRVSRESVFTFFESIENLGTLNCKIIGWLVDNMDVTSFSWSSEARAISISGEPSIDGSGKENFERNLREVRVHLHYTNVTGNDIPKALREALGHAGYIIGKELATGETIYALYGGGIEVIYFDGRRFRYVHNITYLFWPTEIIFYDKIAIKPSPVILTYRYHRDFLTIKAVRAKFAETTILPEAGIELHVIPHFCRDGAKFHAFHLAKSFDKPTYCCNFFFARIHDLLYVTSCLVFDYASENNKLLHIEQITRDGKIIYTVSLSDTLLKIVHSNLNDMIAIAKSNNDRLNSGE